MRRFYSPPESFADGTVTLGADEARHIRDVLRLRTGDKIRVFDGVGGEFEATLASVGKREAILAELSPVTPAAPESPFSLTLAAALMKGEKYDLVVQKAVELGVARLVPLVTKRTDVKFQDSAKRVERWRRIALEASKQCGRARLMEIAGPVEFGAYLAANAGCVLFSERGGARFGDIDVRDNALTALVGPEGGWDDAELELAAKSAAAIVTFGGRILRAETAAVTVAAILQHRFGDLN